MTDLIEKRCYNILPFLLKLLLLIVRKLFIHISCLKSIVTYSICKWSNHVQILVHLPPNSHALLLTEQYIHFKHCSTLICTKVPINLSCTVLYISIHVTCYCTENPFIAEYLLLSNLHSEYCRLNTL